MNAFATVVIRKPHQKIGGPLIIVEIDEAMLHRRKNHLGRTKEQGWVSGGVERPTSRSSQLKKLVVNLKFLNFRHTVQVQHLHQNLRSHHHNHGRRRIERREGEQCILATLIQW